MKRSKSASLFAYQWRIWGGGGGGGGVKVSGPPLEPEYEYN